MKRRGFLASLCALVGLRFAPKVEPAAEGRWLSYANGESPALTEAAFREFLDKARVPSGPKYLVVGPMGMDYLRRMAGLPGPYLSDKIR